MSNYQKPVITVLTEGCEGVYTASGGSCWDVSVGQDIVTTAWYKHFPLVMTHTGAHEKKDPIVTFVFNQDVSVAAIQNVQVIGATISVEGSKVVAHYPAEPPVDPWVNVWTTDSAILNSVDIVSVSAVCAE